MDMTSVMEMALKSGALEQVSGMLGVDEKTAETAIETVMPMLLKGIDRKSVV